MDLVQTSSLTENAVQVILKAMLLKQKQHGNKVMVWLDSCLL